MFPRLWIIRTQAFPSNPPNPFPRSVRRAMSTFNLPDTSPAVPVKLTNELVRDQLLTFPAFKTWLSTLKSSLDLQRQDSHPFHSAPYTLRSIAIQSSDFFGGGRLGFVKLRAEVSNDEGEKLPGSVFLRGGSVAMLLVLQPEDANDESEEYAILTVQPRIPAGSLAFVELPAGMLDDSGTFAGAAAKEIKEETGLEIQEKDLVDMTKLAHQRANAATDQEKLQEAVYPSPGGSDEFMPIFLSRKRMNRGEIEALKGKLTGLRDHSEKITLRLCRLDELWKVGARDGKTLAAVALYEGLRKERMT
jgi:ADP-sugar diphosphatase